MFRDQMAADHGMLFIHDREEMQAYWMKNTVIALDILYFDSQRRLVSQQRDVPPCSAGDMCPPYPSGGPARYVLELNAGQAEKLQLKDGTELKFGPGIGAAGLRPARCSAGRWPAPAGSDPIRSRKGSDPDFHATPLETACE